MRTGISGEPLPDLKPQPKNVEISDTEAMEVALHQARLESANSAVLARQAELNLIVMRLQMLYGENGAYEVQSYDPATRRLTMKPRTQLRAVKEGE